MTREPPFLASRLEFDDERAEVFWKGQRIELSPESSKVLRVIACSPDKVHSAGEIAQGADIRSDDTHLEIVRQFHLIKRAFVAVDSGEFPVKVIPRQGYKWNEPPPPRRSKIARPLKGSKN